MPKPLKGLLLSVAALVIAGFLFLTFVFFPIPMFFYHRQVGHLNVYSDLPINAELVPVLEAAAQRVEAGPLFDPNLRSRVFLAHSQKRFAFFTTVARLRSGGQAMAFTHVGTIIVSIHGVNTVRQRTGGLPRHSRLEGTLIEAIAHEMAHLHVSSRLGYMPALAVPAWKSEGWADFSANSPAALTDPEYDLEARVRMILDDTAWEPPWSHIDRRHFRWQVMIEYLALVRGLSFDQIFDSPLSESQTWDEVKSWADHIPPSPPGAI